MLSTLLIDSTGYEEVELSIVPIDSADYAELGSRPLIVEEHENMIFIILQKISTTSFFNAALSTKPSASLAKAKQVMWSQQCPIYVLLS